mmetsp:Transcript_36801/g.92239  ORF Transcript_36801/g.92239 Transcript_36801/m.92239 type:complete len:211 (+) Transcript_36801:314-946(+)
MKSKSCMSVPHETFFFRKNSVMEAQSRFKKSKAFGPLRSTAWDTSITQRALLWRRRLCGDKSACTKCASWNIRRMMPAHWRYSRDAAALEMSASTRHGAGHPPEPTNDMSNTCLRKNSGCGQRMPQRCRRLRLRNSFSAQILMIFRGFCFVSCEGKRTSPSMYSFRLRNSFKVVLKILMATSKVGPLSMRDSDRPLSCNASLTFSMLPTA